MAFIGIFMFMQVNCRTGVIESTRLLNLKQFIRLHGEITQQASMATMAPEGRERGICASMIIQEWVWAQKWGALPDSKVCGASMGPTWGRKDPGGPHVGPMNLAIWAIALFIIFSVINISDLTKWCVWIFKSYSCLNSASAALLWWHLSNIKVVFNM